jgi:hypothetical protein
METKHVSSLEYAVGISRGVVTHIEEDGTAFVACDASDKGQAFDQLITSAHAKPVLAPSDSVLVWRSEQPHEKGVILGRIAGPDEGSRPVAENLPEELVLEATHALTLRVGDGSITIREDGKILIKGKDLVSHAQRMNRIKGGAVSIN